MNIEYKKQIAEEKERKIKLIEEFYREYKRLPKRNEKYKGVALGNLLSNIKTGNTSITEKQKERIVALGFGEQTIEKEKEEKIKLVEEFHRENKRLPKLNEKYKGVALGFFLNNIRAGHTHITKEQMERLVALGFLKRIKDREEEKEEKMKLVEEFYREYKRFPKKKEKYKEVALGQFLSNVKSGNTGITDEQMERLVVLGFVEWTKDREEEKEYKIRLIEEFYRENKRLPKRNEKYKGVALSTFLYSIRQGIKSITKEQMERLMKLGFEGQIKDVKIENSIQKIEEFYQKNNRLPEPGESLKNENVKIGDTLLSIRIGKIRITEKQFLRLQQMDAKLTREQVKFFERPHVYVKKIRGNMI